MTTKTKEENLNEIGKSAMSSIRCMVAALECDYDRIEELRDERDGWVANLGGDDDEQNRTGEEWAKEFADESDELKQLEEDAGECKDRDDATERIQEDALEIQFRSGWTSDKSEMQAEEFYILLATGGPAVRIMGELQDGEQHRAWLEVQGWGTPWTEYYEQDAAETLLKYCSCFYMGD